MRSLFRTTLWIFAVLTILLLLVSIVVFRQSMHLTWIDSLYFVITTFTSVGYGDITPVDTPAGVKIFGIFLMVGGVVFTAIILAFITDQLFRIHLDTLMGQRRRKMRNHIVLCGLGAVGIRIMDHLVMFHEKVIIIEMDENQQFIEAAKKENVPVIYGDIRSKSTLESAHIKTAKCVVAATDNDLANLEAALNARALNPDIRVVLRVFDHQFAQKVREGFDIDSAFSTQSISAPAFAMAAIDPSVVGSFTVDDELMLNVELTVNPNSRISHMDSETFVDTGDYAILVHIANATGEKQINPSEPIQLAPGDRMILATPHSGLEPLHAMNKPE